MLLSMIAPMGRLAEMWAWMLRMYFWRVERVERKEEEDWGRKMWRWVREVRIKVSRDSFSRGSAFWGLCERMYPVMISRSRRREKELLRSKRMTAVFLPPIGRSSYVEGRSNRAIKW